MGQKGPLEFLGSVGKDDSHSDIAGARIDRERRDAINVQPASSSS